MAILFKTFHWCLDLFFPKYCLGCGLEDSYLCSDCSKLLLPLKSVSCFICGRRSPVGYACKECCRARRSHLSGILVASDWNNLLLRQIIYEYKYRFIKELVDPLAELMITFLRTNKLADWPTDQLILIPVPLHGRRLTWRGFNQSDLLTQKISARLNLPLIKNILIRFRHALPQREIKNHNARAANIKNAFALSKNYSPLPSSQVPLKFDFKGNPKSNFSELNGITKNSNPLKNKIIILVDDICTTGSTLEDCARALSPLRPKEIWGLVIARG